MWYIYKMECGEWYLYAGPYASKDEGRMDYYEARRAFGRVRWLYEE